MLCVFGEHNYGDPARGQGYEYSNFLPALQQLGYEVDFFESFNRNVYADFVELNRALLQKVDSFRPDVVFCVLMWYEIWLDTLKLIRKAGIQLVSWGPDDSWKYRQHTRYMAPAFDIWITTSHRAWRQAQQDGLKNVMLSQWAVAKDSLHEPLTTGECRYPVSFVGSAYGNRRQWIAELKAYGIEVFCFGYGWPSGAVAVEDIPKIIRKSVVSLNFADSGWHFQGILPYRSRQIKARVFEVPGAGGCLISESAEYLADYYQLEQEIAIFENIAELAAKIQQLLAHPELRDQIAVAGYQRTKAEHTYEQRFAEVFAKLSERQEVSAIDFAAFEALAVRYRIGFIAGTIRKILVTSFQLIWGKDRGSRAARQVLFETSWRLSGKRTYSVSGWPGRFFYRES